MSALHTINAVARLEVRVRLLEAALLDAAEILDEMTQERAPEMFIGLWLDAQASAIRARAVLAEGDQ